MPGKNDVEIAIRARDAVGPGVDSAKAKINRFAIDSKKAVDTLRGAGAAAAAEYFGRAANATLDRLAEVQAKVAEGSLSAAEGAEEMGLSIARSLPVFGQWFQAGEKIRMMLDGTTEALAKQEAAIKAHNQRVQEYAAASKLIQQIDADRLAAQNQLLSPADAANERFRQAQEQIEAQRRRVMSLNIPEEDRTNALRNLNLQFEARRKLHQQELLDAQAAEEKARQEEKDAVAKHEKELADIRKAIRGNLRETVLNLATQGANAPIDAAMDADMKAVQDRIAALRRGGGAVGLPGGESSRFTTGVRESATDRLQSEAAKQTAQNEKQIQLLEKMLEELKNRKPIEFESGVFGGGGA